MSDRRSRSTRRRHDAIRSRLAADRRVQVSTLASELGVAEETVRRDLGALERQGVLVRVHGGAIMPTAGPDAAPAPRTNDDDALVEAVLERMPASGAVFLGSGHVSLRVAQALPDDAGLRIVTNSVEVALLASVRQRSDVYNVGGAVRGDELTGPWADEVLGGLRVDLACIETGAVTDDGEVLVATPQQAALRQAVLARAERGMLVLSGTDPAAGLAVAATVDDVETIVAREPLPPALAARLAERGGELVVPGSAAARTTGRDDAA